MANQGLIIGIIVFLVVVVGIIGYLGYEGNISFIPRHLFTKASGCKDPKYQEYNEEYETSDNETFCQNCVDTHEDVDGACIQKCPDGSTREGTICACDSDQIFHEKTWSCLAPCGTNEVRNDAGDACDCIGEFETVDDACVAKCTDYFARDVEGACSENTCVETHEFTHDSCVITCSTDVDNGTSVPNATNDGCVLGCVSGFTLTDGQCVDGSEAQAATEAEAQAATEAEAQAAADKYTCENTNNGEWTNDGLGNMSCVVETVECEDTDVTKINVKAIVDTTNLVPYIDGNFFCKRRWGSTGDHTDRYGIVLDTLNSEGGEGQKDWRTCAVLKDNDVITTPTTKSQDVATSNNNHQYSYVYSGVGGTCYLPNEFDGTTYNSDLFTSSSA